MRAPHGREQPPITKERAGRARARFARSAVHNRTKRGFGRLVDAAVAARGAGPPGVVADAAHGALELVDVRDEILLAALEGLLELLELGAPALHPVLAQLHVRLELRLAQLELALALRQLEDACVDRRLRDRCSGSRRQSRAAQERSQRIRLLR